MLASLTLWGLMGFSGFRSSGIVPDSPPSAWHRGDSFRTSVSSVVRARIAITRHCVRSQ